MRWGLDHSPSWKTQIFKFSHIVKLPKICIGFPWQTKIFFGPPPHHRKKIWIRAWLLYIYFEDWQQMNLFTSGIIRGFFLHVFIVVILCFKWQDEGVATTKWISSCVLSSFLTPPPHTHIRNKHTHTICVVHLYKLSKTVFQGKFHFSCLKVCLICLLKIIKLLKLFRTFRALVLYHVTCT